MTDEKLAPTSEMDLLEKFKRRGQPLKFVPEPRRRKHHETPPSGEVKFSRHSDQLRGHPLQTQIRDWEENFELSLIEAAAHQQRINRSRDRIVAAIRSGELAFESGLSAEQSAAKAELWRRTFDKLQADAMTYAQTTQKTADQLSAKERRICLTLEKDRNRLIEILIGRKAELTLEERREQLAAEWLAATNDGESLDVLDDEVPTVELPMEVDSQLLRGECERLQLVVQGVMQLKPLPRPEVLNVQWVDFSLAHDASDAFVVEEQAGGAAVRVMREQPEDEAVTKLIEEQATTIPSNQWPKWRRIVEKAFQTYATIPFLAFRQRIIAARNLGILLNRYAMSVHTTIARGKQDELCYFAEIVDRCWNNGLIFRWVEPAAAAYTEWRPGFETFPVASWLLLQVGGEYPKQSGWINEARFKTYCKSVRIFTEEAIDLMVSQLRRIRFARKDWKFYGYAAGMVAMLAIGSQVFLGSRAPAALDATVSARLSAVEVIGTKDVVAQAQAYAEGNATKLVAGIQPEQYDLVNQTIYDKSLHNVTAVAAKQSAPHLETILKECAAGRDSCVEQIALVQRAVRADPAQQLPYVGALNELLQKSIARVNDDKLDRDLRINALQTIMSILKNDTEALKKLPLPPVDDNAFWKDVSVFADSWDRAVQDLSVEQAAKLTTNTNNVAFVREVLEAANRVKTYDTDNPQATALMEKAALAFPGHPLVAQFFAWFNGYIATRTLDREKAMQLKKIEEIKQHPLLGTLERLMKNSGVILGAVSVVASILSAIFTGPPGWTVLIGVGAMAVNAVLQGANQMLGQLKEVDEEEFRQYQERMKATQKPNQPEHKPAWWNPWHFATVRTIRQGIGEMFAPAFNQWQIANYRAQGGAKTHNFIDQEALSSSWPVFLAHGLDYASALCLAIGGGARLVGMWQFGTMLSVGFCKAWLQTYICAGHFLLIGAGLLSLGEQTFRKKWRVLSTVVSMSCIIFGAVKWGTDFLPNIGLSEITGTSFLKGLHDRLPASVFDMDMQTTVGLGFLALIGTVGFNLAARLPGGGILRTISPFAIPARVVYILSTRETDEFQRLEQKQDAKQALTAKEKRKLKKYKQERRERRVLNGFMIMSQIVGTAVAVANHWKTPIGTPVVEFAQGFVASPPAAPTIDEPNQTFLSHGIEWLSDNTKSALTLVGPDSAFGRDISTFVKSPYADSSIRPRLNVAEALGQTVVNLAAQKVVSLQSALNTTVS